MAVMLTGSSFIEAEEDEGEGDKTMDSSSAPGGGGRGHPERVLTDEGGFGSQSLTGLDKSKRSKLHPDPVSNHTESSASEQPEQERARTHRELMKMMREMKKRMPSEIRGHRKTRTVEALHYALSCVKQVQASSEYHKLLQGSRKEEQREVSPTVCSLEELERVTSEHTLKNTGTFVVVFSLTSGRVVYVSQQAPSILGCKGSFLSSVRIVELLCHQDVNIFYSHTAQSHLPPWIMGSDRKADLYDCTRVKSFFCRLRGSKDSDGEVRYNPFRITPYLLKVQGGEGEGEGEGEEPCCLALAERVHSGYEAPRIPLEKRIFTTTHSPNCVFMEVDDRAVPLLGYLPQDLIGSSVLACLHPEDRPLMLALHHKILKYAGQRPFEYSPIRLRCQNGDYVTLDTSWSSFINPWSRKVAFVIGRHKVRTGPLNEEVFATQSSVEQSGAPEEIQELQTQIYRLFLQPVHSKGSSGYGSMGSNGSHEPYISMASSSDSNGNMWEDSHREPLKMQRICADSRKIKSWDFRSRPTPMGRCTAGPTAPPHTSQPMECGIGLSPSHKDTRKQHHIPSYQQINCVDSIIRYLQSYAVPPQKRKSECGSVVAEEAMLEDPRVSGGQCSYSSTIVHVPQPESEVTALEDAPMGSEQADPAPPPPRPQPSPLGLTKEVLSAHTQKEEQEYVGRFRHRILQSPYRSYLQRDGSSPGQSQLHGYRGDQAVGGAGRRKSRVREPKPKRRQEQWSSDSYASPPEGHFVAPSPCPSGGPSQSSAVGLAPSFQQATGVPHAPLFPGPQPQGLPLYQGFQAPPIAAGVGPYMPPVMAVVLPNFPAYPPTYPIYPQGPGLLAPTTPFFLPPFGPSPFPAFPGGSALVPQAPPPTSPSPAPADVDPSSQLFSSSRSSSPLQLNLLQEELPKPAQPQGPAGGQESQQETHRKEEEARSESGNHDNQSTSSEMLDLLLHEDSHSRTGSNASGSGSGVSGGSLGSGSNGTSTSNTGSGNSSLYFGCSDSSHTSPPASRGQPQGEKVAEDRANFEQCVENSLWSLIQHMPESVMMTYQISPRDPAQVLKEDREKLLLLAPLQPVFTEAQKEELAEVHPWIKEHCLPQEINMQGCETCKPAASSTPPPTPDRPYPLDQAPLDPSLDT
ncbi:hypothetical protein SKAU_G00114100 [Synaphobranchus kaupii]|uniref:PAS domain-containing protein n=1 Tax=Synaphobranchus kaupii TaxID=118154 RepID=A0A9Q1G1A3_SYNKA|nr:hypothetical protein SKAU_G00114100 [Synaphobranchus kaupii]